MYGYIPSYGAGLRKYYICTVPYPVYCPVCCPVYYPEKQPIPEKRVPFKGGRG